ncbi:hypothetical protein SNE40_015844 [Patella caerulea]|uniref:Polysaccharide lyase 14 domain-containing protein n=1 Tax=Patella caerulea TaxID=87958 RepID=A0AAN8JLZ6_PATCE
MMNFWLLFVVGVNLVNVDNSRSVNKREDKVLWHLDKYNNFDTLYHFKPLEVGFYNHGSLSSMSDPTDHDRRVIRIFYMKGSYSQTKGYRGAQFYSTPTSPQTSMKFSYEIYFADGFDFVKGGMLPGLAGGDLANCSGGRYSDTCFSSRFMWREHGDGEIYAYIPQQSSHFCHRKDVICSSSHSSVSLGRGSFRFKSGKWMKISQHVGLNDVGKDNGFLQIWLDDHLVYTGHDITWRTKDDVKITSIFFSTFFGGSSSDYAATEDTYTYFRNFILSTGSDSPIVG